MPDTADMQQAHEVRITAIEKRQDRIDNALERLAEDMHQLAVAAAQQAEDRAALKRAFTAIDKLDQRFDALEKRIDETETNRLRERIAEQGKAIDDDNRAKRALVFEIGRNVIIIAAALFAYHLGVKLL